VLADKATSNLRKIIGASIGFIVLIVIAIVLDAIESLYKNNNAPFAISVLVTLGIVMPVVIIILSSIGRVNLKTNPKLLYGFSIATLVMMGLIAIGLVYGAQQDFAGIQDDILYNNVVALSLDATLGVLLAIGILPVVLVIVFAVKDLPITQPFLQQGMASARTANSRFCPHCGAPNSADAEFCNKCGQAL
jgi:ribosomal protein L40E